MIDVSTWHEACGCFLLRRTKLEQLEAQAAAVAAAQAAAEEERHAQEAPHHKARTEARKVRLCKVADDIIQQSL